MRPFLLAFLLCCGFALSGCGVARKEAVYTPPDTPAGRLCVEECRESFEYCKKDCRLEVRGCIHEMQGQAIHDYEAYVRDQVKSHEPVDLHARDFERPEKCGMDLCYGRCDRHYQECYIRCGGKVDTSSGCFAFCL